MNFSQELNENSFISWKGWGTFFQLFLFGVVYNTWDFVWGVGGGGKPIKMTLFSNWGPNLGKEGGGVPQGKA